MSEPASSTPTVYDRPTSDRKAGLTFRLQLIVGNGSVRTEHLLIQSQHDGKKGCYRSISVISASRTWCEESRAGSRTVAALLPERTHSERRWCCSARTVTLKPR